MRRDRWLTCLISALLSGLMSFGAVMCLQSAFGLQANVWQVALGCAIAAVAFSLGFSVKFWYIPLLVAAPLAGYLWQKGSLAGSVERLLYQISIAYHQAYGTGLVYWSEKAPVSMDVTVALCAIGCVICLVSAWTVCRKKPVILSLLVAVLPLAACFVVTDRVPGNLYLFLLLWSMLMLLLGSLTRRKDPAKGNLLTAMMAIPVVIALLVLFLALPRDTYRGQERADRILQTVLSWVRDAGKQTGIGGSGGLDQRVELDSVGRLVQTHTPVMTVSLQSGLSNAQNQTQTLYLRKQGYQMYDGTGWYNEYGNDIYRWINWQYMDLQGQVDVATRDQHYMKFVPYYAEDVTVSDLGITENLGLEYSYSFAVSQLRPDAPSTDTTPSAGGILLPVGEFFPDAVSLPASTVEWAEPVALALTEGKTTVQTQAEAIGTYVRNLADYSRNTTRMPAGERDFARWFTEQADTGYCVHFATTATVLLRAAGIHAQYVEGYVAQVTIDGTATTVYEDQAHAWVEYYDPVVGWRILESTPPEGVPTYTYAPQNGLQPTTPEQTPGQPEPTIPEQETPAEQTKSVWPGLWWLLGIALAVLVTLAQWQLRVRWRYRWLTTGTVNGRAVKLWQEITRLSRLTKKRPGQTLYQLAQKAKFSQHVLSQAELTQLTRALEQSRQLLRQKPWYLQLWYTLVHAVY